MADVQRDLASLGQHLEGRRDAILKTWQANVQRDPALKSGDSLPRVQLFDHIPAILAAFERVLTSPEVTELEGAALKPAAAHGLQRWRQGYDLREVTRELGKLNDCLVAEIDAFATAQPHISTLAMAVARRLWATISSAGIEESVGQYFELQQREATGQVRDLEKAMQEIREIETQRADLWRQAAHDLRGNLGVVATATVGLTHAGLRESSRDEFVRILMRNVTSLHHLLDDVTSLARLQAGREARRIEPLDVTPMMVGLCEGIRPLAQQRRLFLRADGPESLETEGDAVKIRRIAQNLILNAVKFTREGGITVSWGDSDPSDRKRWVLCIRDTGPGLHTPSNAPLAQALEGKASAAAEPPESTGETETAAPAPGRAEAAAAGAEEAGEGIGLSIVKRLCEMLDATLEMKSVEGAGTSFRILFPRSYSA
jgi:signal transduction histidine kinase